MVAQKELVALTDTLVPIGCAPSDVAAVTNTHLHFDHCGENRLFAGARINVQAAEYADEGPAVGGDWDDAAYARSLALVRALAPQRVYFSHDTTVWTKKQR